MTSYLIYTPTPNDWLEFTAELGKIGTVSTDSSHAVALSTNESSETVNSIIRDRLTGRHYVIVEVAAGSFSYSGPTSVRNLIEALR